ncbi:MAG: iron-containing alcohol dehydrogenase [Pseudomonadota bacterium]
MTAASSFRASGYAWRLFCGADVIGEHLSSAVARAGGRRAFVLCSPSVNRRTDTVARITDALGARFAGVFDEIEHDSTFASVCRAREAAEEARADLLIAVGGGSVIVASRAVAIFLAEKGDPFELMTQYPPGGRPFSPRLDAPKLPIINVPATPTSAMNRAGTGLKNTQLTQRMEYFDPKTRPQAVLIDDDVLASVPDAVFRSTATTVFAAAVSSQAPRASNPLVEADQEQVFKLAHSAYQLLADNAADPDVRRQLTLAAFLQNRAEDDGRALIRGGAFAGDYAVATALHIRYPHIGQGESTSVLHAPALRLAPVVDAGEARRVASALQVGLDEDRTDRLAAAVATELERLYRANGMPERLRSIGVERDSFEELATGTLKNFNSRSVRGTDEERIANTVALLEAAW